MHWSRLLGIVLVLCCFVAPAQANDASITGTVTYRERYALPPDAFLQVTLVQLPSRTPVAGSAAAIPAHGGVPIAFTLNVRTPLDPVGAYGLVADIASRGRILFRTREPVPLSNGEPSQVTVVFSPGPAVPEPIETPPDPEPAPVMTDRVWTVTSVGGEPTIGDRPLTLSISADFRVGGSAGCNDYFAEATIDGQQLTFGPSATTRMACGPEIMAQEAGFLAALAAVGGFEREGNSLRLLDAAGIPLIGLVSTAE